MLLYALLSLLLAVVAMLFGFGGLALFFIVLAVLGLTAGLVRGR